MGRALLTLFVIGIVGVAAPVLIPFLIWWLWLRLRRPEEECGRFEPDATVDIVRGDELVRSLRESLGGSLTGAADPGEKPPSAVVWTDLGDEVLVHLDSITIEVGHGVVTASLALESDQTGRQTLKVPFAVGESREDASLIAVTEELPVGHPELSARWGRSVHAALWNGVLDLARTRAGVAEGVPGRIWVEGEDIFFEASKAPTPYAGRRPAKPPGPSAVREPSSRRNAAAGEGGRR